MTAAQDAARGALLWEYRPPAAHPILPAALIVLCCVFALGSIENLARESRPELYALYALPVLLVALLLLATRRGPVRIFESGIEPGRPMVMAWHRPFTAWSEVSAVWPAPYDVTGAFVSPFASSDGKVSQLGLALETARGTEVVRFTPTRFLRGRSDSRGFREAWDTVQGLFARQGRVPVPQPPVVPADEADRLLREARRPFLPFWVIVLLFAAAAPVALLALKLGAGVPLALVLGLSFPLLTSLQSALRSRRRHAILRHLAKASFGRGAA
jgi:hypothetical protein